VAEGRHWGQRQSYALQCSDQRHRETGTAAAGHRRRLMAAPAHAWPEAGLPRVHAWSETGYQPAACELPLLATVIGRVLCVQRVRRPLASHHAFGLLCLRSPVCVEACADLDRVGVLRGSRFALSGNTQNRDAIVRLCGCSMLARDVRCQCSCVRCGPALARVACSGCQRRIRDV
jgi:hypothetical protein